MSVEKLIPTAIRSDDCPAHSQLLCQLCYPGPHIWECNVKMIFKVIGLDSEYWIDLVHDTRMWS